MKEVKKIELARIDDLVVILREKLRSAR